MNNTYGILMPLLTGRSIVTFDRGIVANQYTNISRQITHFDVDYAKRTLIIMLELPAAGNGVGTALHELIKHQAEVNVIFEHHTTCGVVSHSEMFSDVCFLECVTSYDYRDVNSTQTMVMQIKYSKYTATSGIEGKERTLPPIDFKV